MEKVLHETDSQNLLKLKKNIKGFVMSKWKMSKTDLLYASIKEKFFQNPKILELLLSTGLSELRRGSNEH